MLTYLTGKDYNDWDVVSGQPEEKYIPADASYAAIAPSIANEPKRNTRILYATIGVTGFIFLAGFRRFIKG
jgi:hypothetical protein